jgi:hypothetical protein
MGSTVIDEIEAFSRSPAVAAARNWSWRPPYWLDLNNSEWSVRSEGEFEVRLDAASGEVRPADAALASLDPRQALMLAREAALQAGHKWHPSFSLELTPAHWIVGARQDQLGGQLTIYVDHSSSRARRRTDENA